MQRSTKNQEDILRSEWSRVLKKDLTEPTFLEMSGMGLRTRQSFGILRRVPSDMVPWEELLRYASPAETLLDRSQSASTEDTPPSAMSGTEATILVPLPGRDSTEN